MITRRKGQYSTFMKPILVLIFGGLLMSLLVSSINFNLGLSEDRSQVRFQSSPKDVHSELVNCVSSEGGDSMNQTVLEELERTNKLSQPECASNYELGYSASVKQEFIDPLEPQDEEIDKIEIAFVLDDTASMDVAINGVKNNIRNFGENTGDSEAAIVTFKDSGDVNVDQKFTEDTSSIESTLTGITASGGKYPEEAVSDGLKKALNDLKWSQDSNKVIVVVNNDGAHDCNALEDAADEADNRDITIYSVFSSGSCSNQIKNYLPSNTGGQHFKFQDSWNKILGDIAGEIVTDKVKYRQGSTCTAPEIPSYNDTAELVITADASKGYAGEWYMICNQLNETVKKLESRGLNTKISYYAPSNPGMPHNGKAEPATLTNGKYNYNIDQVPSCLKSSENNAETSSNGKGITKWEGKGLTSYNSSIDSGIEAWGTSSKWILENHNWDSAAGKKMLVVLGNQLPSGGNSSKETFREDDKPDKIDSEVEIVNNISSIAREKDVEINTMSKDFEYGGKDMFGDNSKNDALELMENTSSQTGGSHLKYENIGRIPGKIRSQFTDLSDETLIGGTCQDVEYNFGQTKGSQGENLDNSLRSTFPSSIKVSEDLTTGATTSIEIRQGSLEKLAGAISKAADTGKRFGEESSLYVSISNDESLVTTEREIEKTIKTDYKLQEPNGDTKIDVEDDLIIGINGRPVFKDMNEAKSTIDFSKTKNQFTAYRGANIQIIALNTDKAEQGLDKIELSCVGNCDRNQTLNPEKIDASKGTEEYLRRGERGVFYTNYTKIKIGETKKKKAQLLCYENTKNCIELNSDKVDDLKLRPGSHEVLINYNSSEGVTFR